MPRVAVAWARPPGSASGLAHALLRAEVARTCGTTPDLVRLARLCRRCGSSEHGRPVVLPWNDRPPPHVSIGRSPDLVVVAVSRHDPVGVDVERLDAAAFEGFDEVVLHDQERATSFAARAVTWVRKESLLKATGQGLSVDLHRIRVSDPDQPPELLEWAAPDRPGTTAWMYDVAVDSNHTACVTVLSDDAPEISLREAAPEEPLHEASPRRVH